MNVHVKEPVMSARYQPRRGKVKCPDCGDTASRVKPWYDPRRVEVRQRICLRCGLLYETREVVTHVIDRPAKPQPVV